MKVDLRILRGGFLAIIVSALASCKDPAAGEPPETLYTGEYDETAMDEAIADARANLDHFLASLQAGPGEEHCVKAPIEDGEHVEHFWLVDISYEDGVFSGTVNNEPGLVSNVKLGDKVSLKKEEVSDWLYMADDRMHGNYTLRVMLPGMPPEQAEAFRAVLAPLPD